MPNKTNNYSIFKSSDEGYYIGQIVMMTAPMHERVSEEYETKEEALNKLKEIIVNGIGK